MYTCVCVCIYVYIYISVYMHVSCMHVYGEKKKNVVSVASPKIASSDVFHVRFRDLCFKNG